MTENKLFFLKEAFGGLDLQFTDDFSSVVIINPHWNENITVCDDEYAFVVRFSFQHRHFEAEKDVIKWIREIINGAKVAIEFFGKGDRSFGYEIKAEELEEISYQKLERFTGYYGLTKLKDVADSFKVRGWDVKSNFDYSFIREADGTVTLSKTAAGGR